MIATDHLPSRLGRSALGRYRGQPLAVRAHVLVRALSLPLDAVVAVLPARGRVLDVGCGHGLVTLAAALSGPGRTVVGTDVDTAKLAAARAAVGDLRDRVAFRPAEDGRLPAGPWDAVLVVDVLYLLDRADQRRLVQACVEALAPGGSLLVKEVATSPRWKYRLTELQELVSVRVARITAGDRVGFLDPQELVGWLEEAGLEVSQHRLDRGRLHPHHLVVGRNGPPAPPVGAT